MGATPVAARPLRSDAARNRERVLAAAAELFAERGMSVGVPAVAERAGVGKGTVYRSYPTKERLIAAVLERRMAWFQQRVEQAASSAGQERPSSSWLARPPRCRRATTPSQTPWR